MKIGIIGTGHIGKTLARKLAAAGHSVKVANSRGPETIEAETLETGALSVRAEEAVTGVDVLILSVPLMRIPDISPLVKHLPADAVVADTSNYYPQRDQKIDNIENGQVESLWVEQQLGRSVIKAWNAIGSGSFAAKGKPTGAKDRIATPVAGDNKQHRELIMSLVSDTGFDAYDAGSLADSWRQQPGSPVYGTDLHYDEIADALASAEVTRLARRRDLAAAIFSERAGDSRTNPDSDFGVRVSRLLYM